MKASQTELKESAVSPIRDPEIPSLRKLIDSTTIIAVFSAGLIFLGMRVQYYYLDELKLPVSVSDNFGWFIARGFDTCLSAINFNSDTGKYKWLFVIVTLLALFFRLHRKFITYLGEDIPTTKRLIWFSGRIFVAIVSVAILFGFLYSAESLGKKLARKAIAADTCKWVQLAIGEKTYVGKLLGTNENDYVLRMDDNINLFLPRTMVTSTTYRVDLGRPSLPSYPKSDARKTP